MLVLLLLSTDIGVDNFADNNSRFRSSSAIMNFTKLGGQVGLWPLLVFTSKNRLFLRILKFLNLQVYNFFWDNLVCNTFYGFYDHLYWLIWPRSEFGQLTGNDFSLFMQMNSLNIFVPNPLYPLYFSSESPGPVAHIKNQSVNLY